MSRRTDLDDVVAGLIAPHRTETPEELSLFDMRALADLREGQKLAANGDPLREKMHRLGQLKKKSELDPEFTKKLVAQFNAPVDRGSLERAVASRGASAPPVGLGTKIKGLVSKIKRAEDVEYGGQVNNGIATAPEWPRAALGIDSAGRLATREERRQQDTSVSPDVQHVSPRTDGEGFVTKGAHDEKLISLFSGGVAKVARELQSHKTVEDLTKNMKPGDVVLMTPQPLPEDAGLLQRIGGSVFGAVSGAIQGKYTHAGIYTGDGNVIDIRAETGVRKVPLKSLTKDLGVAVVRPNVRGKARQEAVQRAESYFKNRDKIHYNTKDLIPAAASAFMDIGDKPINENQVICSSMVANAFGKHRIAPGVARHATKPSDFLQSPRVSYVGKYDAPTKVSAALGKYAGMNDRAGMALSELFHNNPSAVAAAEKLKKTLGPPRGLPVGPRTDRTRFIRISNLDLPGVKKSSMKVAFKPGQILTGGLSSAAPHDFGGIASAIRKFESGEARAARREAPTLVPTKPVS